MTDPSPPSTGEQVDENARARVREPKTKAAGAPSGLSQQISEMRHGLEASIAEGFDRQEQRAAEVEAHLEGRLRVLKEAARTTRDIQGEVLKFSNALLAISNVLEERSDSTDATSTQLRRVEDRLVHVQSRVEAQLTATETAAAVDRSRSEPQYQRFFELAQPVVASGRTLLDYQRLRTLWYAAKNAARLGLPCAEVGSFRGGSALFLASALRDAAGEELPLHVFDTFDGHVRGQVSDKDSAHHAGPVFEDTDAEDVTRYLSAEFGRVDVHVGDVVAALPNLKLESLGLVHLDIDLYKPTLACLRHFGPRLALGGAIVVDDYGAPKCPGIARALEAFLDETGGNVQVWPTATEQAVLVRVREPVEVDE